MLTLDETDEAWLIEQFVAGDLPTVLHSQIEQRMQMDTIYAQRVLGQWLVLSYLNSQREITDFYQQWAHIPVNAAKRKEVESRKGIRYLPQLLIAAVVLLICVFGVVRYSQPPQRQVSNLSIQTDDTENFNFSGDEDSLVVVQYDRSPDFWSFGLKYTWRADTITLYGLPIQKVDGWRIAPTNRRGVYLLHTPAQTYQLQEPQPTLTPLQPHERP